MGFVAGSLPFSIWIGRYWLSKDIRAIGDANPGATNVLRAGGRSAAAIALLLDLLKGSIPVGIAYLHFGIDDGWLVPVALAPALGHAFSPLLGGRGGKAVATTGGIWIALTAWEGPTVGGTALAATFYLLGANGWAVSTAIMIMLSYLLLTPPSWNGLMLRPAPKLIAWIGFLNLCIIAWKHRDDLAHPPHLRRRKLG